MNRFIIKKYINKLTKQDIINYIYKQNIELSPNEIDIIYYYIKNKYNEFLNGNDQNILIELKQKVSPKTYHILKDYYNTYKNKIWTEFFQVL